MHLNCILNLHHVVVHGCRERNGLEPPRGSHIGNTVALQYMYFHFKHVDDTLKAVVASSRRYAGCTPCGQALGAPSDPHLRACLCLFPHPNSIQIYTNALQPCWPLGDTETWRSCSAATWLRRTTVRMMAGDWTASRSWIRECSAAEPKIAVCRASTCFQPLCRHCTVHVPYSG